MKTPAPVLRSLLQTESTSYPFNLFFNLSDIHSELALTIFLCTRAAEEHGSAQGQPPMMSAPCNHESIGNRSIARTVYIQGVAWVRPHIATAVWIIDCTRVGAEIAAAVWIIRITWVGAHIAIALWVVRITWVRAHIATALWIVGKTWVWADIATAVWIVSVAWVWTYVATAEHIVRIANPERPPVTWTFNIRNAQSAFQLHSDRDIYQILLPNMSDSLTRAYLTCVTEWDLLIGTQHRIALIQVTRSKWLRGAAQQGSPLIDGEIHILREGSNQSIHGKRRYMMRQRNHKICPKDKQGAIHAPEIAGMFPCGCLCDQERYRTANIPSFLELSMLPGNTPFSAIIPACKATSSPDENANINPWNSCLVLLRNSRDEVKQAHSQSGSRIRYSGGQELNNCRADIDQ